MIERMHNSGIKEKTKIRWNCISPYHKSQTTKQIDINIAIERKRSNKISNSLIKE
jgi:hypothetical protein